MILPPAPPRRRFWDGTAQIQQRMQLDRRIGPAEARPGKQVQAQVNGDGIQRINRLVEFRSNRVAGVKGAGAADEQLSQIMVDAPVTLAVGVGQDAAGNLAMNAQVIELLVARAQTGFHIAETFPKGELAKSHAKKLVPAGEGFHFVVSAVASHTAVKLLRMNQVGELGENKLSGIHPGSLANDMLGENRIKTSSRSHPRLGTRGP